MCAIGTPICDRSIPIMQIDLSVCVLYVHLYGIQYKSGGFFFSTLHSGVDFAWDHVILSFFPPKPVGY